MPASYDPETEAGKVRLLISDIGGDSSTDFIFEDNEIQAFLNMEGNIKLAAASALRTIAANSAMVLKVIKFMELSTDGAKVAKVLLETAKELEERAVEDDDDTIDIISMNLNKHSEDELIANRLRGLG
jgi:hypothetical protein